MRSSDQFLSIASVMATPTASWLISAIITCGSSKAADCSRAISPSIRESRIEPSRRVTFTGSGGACLNTKAAPSMTTSSSSPLIAPRTTSSPPKKRMPVAFVC